MGTEHGMVIWLIGLSGAGKTTVGRLLSERLKAENPATIFLDGDMLRDVWGDNLGHTVEARAVNAARISHLCRVLADQGMTVVASVLSLFPDWQQWNRNTFARYYEVFLHTPMDVLEARDTKGLYKGAKEGRIENVVGVDIPFPEPPLADLVVDSSGRSGAPAETVEAILSGIAKTHPGVLS